MSQTSPSSSQNSEPKLLLSLELPFAVASRNRTDKMHWTARQRYRDFIHHCVSLLLSTNEEPIGTLVTLRQNPSLIRSLRITYAKVTKLLAYAKLYDEVKLLKRLKRKGR